MTREFLYRHEVAKILGISMSTVSRLWKKKEPPFNSGIKVGRRVLFPKSCITIQQTGLTFDSRSEVETPSGSVG